jgi:hypothetical protein
MSTIQLNEIRPRYADVSDAQRQEMIGITALHCGQLYRSRFEASEEGVRAVLRRLRRQEAVKLQEVDDRIARLRQEILDAENARKVLLDEAFDNGNYVATSELCDAATTNKVIRRSVKV